MPKRRGGNRRVTPKKGRTQHTDGLTAASRPARPQPHRAAVADSGRYTAPKVSYRVRPKWHRVAGWTGVALGILIAVANDAMLFTDGVTLLPLGHQELYLILGVLVAGSSTWFLGLFDRGTTIYD